MSAPYDMTRFMIGDGRLYEVLHSAGSQARHQTQIEGERFYFTKGNEVKAEWEELWEQDSLIYRGTDTSPGNNQYYSLYENGVLQTVRLGGSRGELVSRLDLGEPIKCTPALAGGSLYVRSDKHLWKFANPN